MTSLDGASRSRPPLVIVTLCMAVLAGCTTTSAGTPFSGPTTSKGSSSSQSSNGSPPTSDEELPSNGAPKVDNPLDVSQFEQRPCEVLTAEQTQSLGLPTSGEPIEDAIGKGCRWHNEETRGVATIYFSSSDQRGLSSVYREAKGSGFPYFKQIEEVEGYPAVAFSTDEENPTTDCTVAVGVSDQLVFGARLGVPADDVGQRDPCETATQAAGMMMTTMQEAS